jgi:DNA-binding response OmpR family regulator/predicted regulator of Ras-like GTPase activity (Roadblock/LC7/MglB family)
MRVLVVDPNTGFAALVAGELERLGHEVVICQEGYEAYRAAQALVPDLALLDIGLQEPDAPALARTLRLQNPELRLMLIAAADEQVSLVDGSPSIQGVLPRPFFLPDLPGRIEAVLAAPLGVSKPDEVAQPEVEMPTQPDDRLAASEVQSISAAAASVMAPESEPAAESGTAETLSLSRRMFRLHQGEIESLMSDLARDVGAAGVLLTSANGLLTVVGTLDEAEIDAVSRAVIQGRQTSAEVARILGREQVRFEQSTAGDSHMLYALGVHDYILALMVKGEPQLGLLRHRARAMGERIAALCANGG